MNGAPKNNGQQSENGNRPPKESPTARVLRALKRRYHARKYAARKDKEANEQILARWSRNVGLFTAALVGVSLITAAIFKWQLDAMTEQLAAMRGQLEESRTNDRPYLFLDKLKITQVFSNRFPRIQGTFTNAGKTPATIRDCPWAVVPASSKNMPDFALNETISCTATGGILGADRSTGNIEFFQSFPRDMTPFRTKQQEILFYGEISYEDVFGDVHVDRFGFLVSAPATMEMLQKDTEIMGNDVLYFQPLIYIDAYNKKRTTSRKDFVPWPLRMGRPPAEQ